jgi:hypothetical protein
MNKYTIHSTFVTLVFALMFIAACEKPSSTKTNNAPTTPPAKTDAGTHADSSAGHGGPVIELGTATIGPFTVRASRDQGEVKPAGDAPIDVWLTGGDISKVTAVRFWIGTEQGDNFVKAKADIEIPSEPNHWHTHAEVPSPLPTGSKLWVEIEVDGQKHAGSFELKS